MKKTDPRNDEIITGRGGATKRYGSEQLPKSGIRDDEVTGLKAGTQQGVCFLLKKHRRHFTPIELSREIGVTNKTVINRLAALVKTGFVEPNTVNERIRSYHLSDFGKQNEQEIIKEIQ